MPRGREDDPEEEDYSQEVRRMERTERRRKRGTASADEDYANGNGTQTQVGDEDRNELVKRCVRFLIARNSKGRPVKRSELSKYVMDGRSRAGKAKLFTQVLGLAEEELQNVFSMKMTEVFRKVQPSASMSARTQTQNGSEPNVTKAYILTSTLPADNRPVNRDDWCKLGFITTIAAIIALTPEVKIEQDDLYRALERMGAPVKESGGHEQINFGNVKEFVENTLKNQWYLEIEKDPTDVNTVYYKIGARLWAELSVGDLLKFIEVVYNSNGNEDSNIGLDESAKKELWHKLEVESNLSLGLEDEE